jgi:hypothetical protein
MNVVQKLTLAVPKYFSHNLGSLSKLKICIEEIFCFVLKAYIFHLSDKITFD